MFGISCSDFQEPHKMVSSTVYRYLTPNDIPVTQQMWKVKVKANQSHYRPEVPRGFQEVKVPRLRDNGPGWW